MDTANCTLLVHVFELKMYRKINLDVCPSLSRRASQAVDNDNYFPVLSKKKIFTHQREICPLNGCSLGLREEKDEVRLLAAASRGHRTAVSQTTCNENQREHISYLFIHLTHPIFFYKMHTNSLSPKLIIVIVIRKCLQVIERNSLEFLFKILGVVPNEGQRDQLRVTLMR